ncbi:hypothetical protein B0A55_12058, partial [Friedmanniomyces simplex]
MTSNGKNIAVIGAGAAGLAAAKYLLAEGFRVTMFERKASPGGVWNTAPGNGYWPSPVYEGLETNVPRTLMTLSDHAWPEDASLFPRSEVVRDYLQDYAAGVLRSALGSANLRITMSSRRCLGKEEEVAEEFFDGVVVASGNYHQPFVPKEYNVGEWCEAHPGSLLHAVDCCKREDFRDQTVLVLGNGASGWDISFQLAGVANMVIHSLDASMRSVTFTDGRAAYNVDRIIFCTGYVYNFSFIRKGTVCGDEKLFETGLKVADVYQHIWYTHDPSLAFVGLPSKSASFTVAEEQSAVVARAFADRIKIWRTPDLKRWQKEDDAEWERAMEAGKVGAVDYHSFRVMGSILVMQNFQAHFPTLTGSTIQGWLVSALELGAWGGALFNGYLADKISRKYSMLVAVIVFTLGTCLQAAAQNPAMLFAGRVIGGIGIGMFSMVIPLYQAEIAPPQLRGSLVSLQQLSITIGTTIAFWLDYGLHFVGGSNCDPAGVTGTFDPYTAHGHTCLAEKSVSWRVPLALQLIPAWILFFGMFFLPFSPRWLMMKHRDEDCINALTKLRRLARDDPLLTAEYLEIKAAVLFDEETEAEIVGTAGRLGPWKMLFSSSMLKRLNIGCWIMIFQQFTGINAVLYYAPQIFATFGFSSVVFTLPAVLFLDNFGRKTFLIAGAIGM